MYGYAAPELWENEICVAFYRQESSQKRLWEFYFLRWETHADFYREVVLNLRNSHKFVEYDSFFTK